MKNKQGLYAILLKRIKKTQRIGNKEIIAFPLIFKKICPSFSLSKKELWPILFLIRDMGLIEIVPYRGIKITKFGNEIFT